MTPMPNHLSTHLSLFYYSSFDEWGRVEMRRMERRGIKEPQLVTKSKYVKKKHIVDNSDEGLRLIIDKYAKSKEEKSFILTGDDVTVSLLDQHYDELKDYFYFYNAGEAGRVRRYMNKDEICSLATKHGFKIPRTWKVKPGEIPEDIEYPIMTKGGAGR